MFAQGSIWNLTAHQAKYISKVITHIPCITGLCMWSKFTNKSVMYRPNRPNMRPLAPITNMQSGSNIALQASQAARTQINWDSEKQASKEGMPNIMHQGFVNANTQIHISACKHSRITNVDQNVLHGNCLSTNKYRALTHTWTGYPPNQKWWRSMWLEQCHTFAPWNRKEPGIETYLKLYGCGSHGVRETKSIATTVHCGLLESIAPPCARST